MYMYYNWKMKLFILVSLVKYQVQLFTIISYIWSYVFEMQMKNKITKRDELIFYSILIIENVFT